MVQNKNAAYIRKRQRMNNLAGYCFTAPAIIGFILFIGGPIIYSGILSFYSYNLIKPATFIGLDNITRMFSDKLVRASFLNTGKFLLILSPIHCILGLLLAFCVYKARYCKFFFRSAIYIPTMVTTASVAIAWAYLFATDTGVINYYYSGH